MNLLTRIRNALKGEIEFPKELEIRATKVSKRGKARFRLPDGFDGFVEQVALHEAAKRDLMASGRRMIFGAR